MGEKSFEVEQKYRVEDPAALQQRLTQLGAVAREPESHCDTYYNHPSRDFAETQEALRVLRVDGVPMVTYKGSKLPGAIKARRELEWRLDPGDPDGAKMEELLQVLGFRQVATVRKTRRTFALPESVSVCAVMIDEVASLGAFAEIERIADGKNGVEAARDEIGRLAAELGLQNAESRSYLRMVLALE